MKLSNLFVGSALLLASFASAQTYVPPPPNLSGSPSLALRASMAFLGDALTRNGSISFVMTAEDTESGIKKSGFFHNEISDIDADPGNCRISFRWKTREGSGVTRSGDSWFSLREVKSIIVSPYDQARNEQSARSGNPNIRVISIDPPVTIIELRQLRDEKYFVFTDRIFADRVAREFNRAVELCGGGS